MVVDPEEITALVHEMNLKHQEQDEVDWFTFMAILFDRYPDDVPRTFCINERMQALHLIYPIFCAGWIVSLAQQAL